MLPAVSIKGPWYVFKSLITPVIMTFLIQLYTDFFASTTSFFFLKKNKLFYFLYRNITTILAKINQLQPCHCLNPKLPTKFLFTRLICPPKLNSASLESSGNELNIVNSLSAYNKNILLSSLH